MHGHTVGGTNPSLVEALWAGNAVIAHANAYNRWTAAGAAVFFEDAESCEAAISRLLADDVMVARLAAAARTRAADAFQWSDVLAAYERECLALAGLVSATPEALPAAKARWA
jgi:glycosyltransferase involved in cell wall biosynthesis